MLHHGDQRSYSDQNTPISEAFCSPRCPKMSHICIFQSPLSAKQDLCIHTSWEKFFQSDLLCRDWWLLYNWHFLCNILDSLAQEPSKGKGVCKVVLNMNWDNSSSLYSQESLWKVSKTIQWVVSKSTNNDDQSLSMVQYSFIFLFSCA